MRISISARNLTRILSFCLAAVLVFFGFFLQSRQEARRWRILLENNYARSMGELSANLTNIATDLEKSRYIGTPAQLAHLSARVWKESGGAKEALGSLPTGELRLDTAYRFLSQAGDYAMSLSKKVLAGETLTEQERANGAALYETAVSLRDYVDDAIWKYTTGQFSPRSLMEADAGTAAVSAGFENLEETVTGYPTLIYDGPFSDHLLNRTPAMLQGAEPVSQLAAAKIAGTAASMAPEALQRQDDENSAMPSYVFHGRNVCVGVTKAGGYVSYLTDGRELGEERLRQDAIFKRAEQFLASIGLEGMRSTYYEKADNVCTINYAAMQDGVILYTDLVKVGVALDDGSIVSYDARGYLMNHKDRTLETPLLTGTQAAQSVSPMLKITSNRLALIPTSGQNEVLTYEFTCAALDNPQQQVLVYVNAATGAEENILLLIHTPGGTLTK